MRPARKKNSFTGRALRLEKLESRLLLAADFTEITAALTAVSDGAAAWGDYDSDGDLDVLITGFDGTNPIARVFRNTSGTFSDISAGLSGVRYSAAAWGDYDNDGDLDILLAGQGASDLIAKVYRNTSGTFSDIGAALDGVADAAVAWGDYDNDGDLDILLAGYDGQYSIAKVYRNTSGVFSDIGANLDGADIGSAAWGDYDNDGDLDILLAGNDGADAIAQVYRNTSGLFSDIGANLVGVDGSAAAWGDYDNDGDLDILLTGYDGSNPTAKVYRNTNGAFSNIAAGLTGVDGGDAAWGDYDNDGDLDILLAGNAAGGPVAQVNRNTGGAFSNISAGLTGADLSSVAWGDYDNDGDLDILLTGKDGANQLLAKVYRNDSATANSAPAAPTGLGTTENGPTSQILTWNAPDDAAPLPNGTVTPRAGLSYNLRVGTSPGGSDVLAPMSLAGGLRTLAQRGLVQGVRAGNSVAWTLQHLTPGQTYYWSVQAVDTELAGGPFAAEDSFTTSDSIFSETTAGLAGARDAALAWGDFDSDGDLDLFLSHFDNSHARSSIYRNNGNSFNDISANLPEVTRSAAAWGDFDRDGDLDLLLTGRSGPDECLARVYRNDGGSSFRNLSAGLTGVEYGSAAWGDYDNDGDLDILITGRDSDGQRTAKVYRNTSGSFADVHAGLSGVFRSSAAWGDFDGDGDLDIVTAGQAGNGNLARIYRNDDGEFTNLHADLAGVRFAALAWGDFDHDGDLDLALAGQRDQADPDEPQSESLARVYRNDGSGAFHDIQAGLTGVRRGALAWGDYDSDGDLDLLLLGQTSAGNLLTRIYGNTDGSFSDDLAGFEGLFRGAAAWGDYDHDGDLDLALGGQDDTGRAVARVFRNVAGTVNDVPNAPTGLDADSLSRSISMLSWTRSSDGHAPKRGLNYNLRVGTTPGGSNVLGPTPLAGSAGSLADGTRKIAEHGLVQGVRHGTQVHWTLTGLSAGRKYYWSVQAVDAGLAGGPFATEGSFVAGQFDFGDAPTAAQSGLAASYPTRFAANGARHLIGSHVYLGAGVDVEEDGQPTAGATGDDAAGSDDEDGVVLPAVTLSGLGARAVVTASADSKLDVWVDFNRDGDWNDAGERIAASQVLAAGTNSVTFTVPAGALAGTTFARFRVSTAGGLAPTGPADDGEVEDYAVTIQTPADNTAALVDDPLNPGHKALLIVGTAASDKLRVDAKGETVEVELNGVERTFGIDAIGRIVVLAKGENDSIKLDRNLAKDAFIDAGPGDDDVEGGKGHNILVGGPGSDSLKGGHRQDVLIGGTDDDDLNGGTGNAPHDSDLLIGGSTVHDPRDAALQAILAEWSSSDAYLTRVFNLRNGKGVPPLGGASILADAAVDSLRGGNDQDWFIAGSEDTLKDPEDGEQADIDGVPQNLQATASAPAIGLPVDSASAPARPKRK